MIDVRRLGHATLETPDLARQIEYWTVVMGLRLVHQDKDRAFLATKLGQEALALERGSQSSLRRVSFQSSRGRCCHRSRSRSPGRPTAAKAREGQ